MTPRWDASRLVFTAEPRGYTYNGLQRLMGVSEVLELSGISPPYTGDEWYGERGTLVHRACDLIDALDLNWSTLDPALLPYCEAYRVFSEKEGFKILHTEIPVAWPEMGIGGTVDRVAERNGRKAIIDIKTGSKPQRSWPVQLQLYELCWKWCDDYGNDEEMPQRIVVKLSKDGTYKLIEYEPCEILAFAAIELAKWQLAGKRK